MLKPCIIGLGYVGLPILLNLSKKFRTIGYDTNKKRISDLNKFASNVYRTRYHFYNLLI